MLRARGHADGVIAIGRDQALAPVDQPKVTRGSWIRDGEVVAERSFADAAGIHGFPQDGCPFRAMAVWPDD